MVNAINENKVENMQTMIDKQLISILKQYLYENLHTDMYEALNKMCVNSAHKEGQRDCKLKFIKRKIFARYYAYDDLCAVNRTSGNDTKKNPTQFLVACLLKTNPKCIFNNTETRYKNNGHLVNALREQNGGAEATYKSTMTEN
ncbi:hypothetical protein GQX74_001887 [Glossina fuscipes]|nr:hypothetical protein GQX74_001887 [Glossina fuscipes]